MDSRFSFALPEPWGAQVANDKSRVGLIISVLILSSSRISPGLELGWCVCLLSTLSALPKFWF